MRTKNYINIFGYKHHPPPHRNINQYNECLCDERNTKKTTQ